MLRVVHDGVTFNDLRRAKSLLDFTLDLHSIYKENNVINQAVVSIKCQRKVKCTYIRSGVFHKYGRIGITLTHLLLSLLKTHQHVMRHDNRLEAHFLGTGVLPTQ